MATTGDPLHGLLWALLGWGVLPTWLLAGLGDYLVHARTGIAQTSGVRESALHLMQTAQIGLPMLGVLLLDVNALVLTIAVAGVLAHSITAWIDLRYTLPRRRIPVFEQFCHAFLIVLPFMALALVAVLHWGAFTGIGTGADWLPRWKRQPFPPAVLAAVLGTSLLVGVLPGLWEFAVTWLAARRTVAGVADAAGNEKAQR